MTTCASLSGMDENMGLATPNFFTSAWNSDQNELSFLDPFQSGGGSHNVYGTHLQQGRVEENQLDYFSAQLSDRFADLPNYQNDFPLGLSQSHADLDRILDSPVEGEFSTQPHSHLQPIPRSAPMEDIESYNGNILDSSRSVIPSSDKWDSHLLESNDTVKLEIQPADDCVRRTSVRFGQITPADSPVDDEEKKPKSAKTSTSKSKSKCDEATAMNEMPKTKKPRKSRKKAMSQEQEEAKRRKFLERNRVAADKCRQNRKKWIDDLQAKVHSFSADNSAKKARLEELEQEVAHMKSMLFIHSRSCNEKDVLLWIDRESSKVNLLSRVESKLFSDDAMSSFSHDLDGDSLSTSRPTSSRGFRSMSDAFSRRYSQATMDEECSSTVSVNKSEHSSRRQSIAEG